MKNESIKVYRGMMVDHHGYREALDVTESVLKFNGCFASNNSTVAYVVGNEMYVAPYTREMMKMLRDAGLKDCGSNFYVPFSNGDYPVAEKARWDELREKARGSYKRDFADDCKKWCDEHSIGSISAETLSKCFQIPDEGVAVKHFYYEDRVFPVCNGVCLDCIVVDRLGRFCTNNGKVVFVHCDGNTYVAKGYGILNELRSAGYREEGLFVPFSNGEQIIDEQMRAIWEALPKL